MTTQNDPYRNYDPGLIGATRFEEDADISTSDHEFSRVVRCIDVLVTDTGGGTLKYWLPGDVPGTTPPRTQRFVSTVYTYAHQIAGVYRDDTEHVQVKGRW